MDTKILLQQQEPDLEDIECNNLNFSPLNDNTIVIKDTEETYFHPFLHEE